MGTPLKQAKSDGGRENDWGHTMRGRGGHPPKIFRGGCFFMPDSIVECVPGVSFKWSFLGHFWVKLNPS